MYSRFKDNQDSFFMEILEEPDAAKQLAEYLSTERPYDEITAKLAASIAEMGMLEKLVRVDACMQWLSMIPLQYLISIFNRTGLIMPPKLKKGGKSAYLFRILTKIDKPKVWKVIKSAILAVVHGAYPNLFAKEEVSPQEWFELVQSTLQKDIKDNHNKSIRIMHMAYTISVTYGKEEFTQIVLENFAEEHWQVLEKYIVSSYRLLYFVQEANGTKDMKTILLERNKLAKDAKKATEQVKALNTQLETLSKSSEEQLTEAITEIEHLREREQELLDMIALRDVQIVQLKEKIGEATLKPLDGLRVVVFGMLKRKTNYQEVVERLGGEYRFLPANSSACPFSKIAGATSWADIVIFLSSYSSHSVSAAIHSSTDSSKVFSLNASGIITFETQILTEVLPRIEKLDIAT
ncbi:hypothetical protein D3C78_17810 [compost metagenome]